MKKKLFCCVIAFMLLVAGCAELPTASYADGSPESSEAGASSAAATEAPESSVEESKANEEIDPNALRICLDVGEDLAQDNRDILLLETELANGIRTAGGPENIVFDSIPYEGSAREIAIERIRTEIMAGEGPDVFIVEDSDALFPIPEKTMQKGVFLTLDDYIQNAKLAEWEALMPVVLEAGRTAQGQQLVPMLYTLPVTVYPKESVPEMPQAGTTWQDMLADESGILRCAASMHRLESSGFFMLPGDGVLPVLGEFVDYETEEILFSEKDLLDAMEKIMELEKESNAKGYTGLPDYFQGRLYSISALTFIANSDSVLSIDRETPVTMIPIYSMDGDVTATVQAYTGINRNTKHPEEAFFIVDYLMSTQAQQELKFYYRASALPLHEAVLSEAHPQQNGVYYFIEENFAALNNVRDQISKVYFDDSLLDALRKPHRTDQRIQSGEITEQALEDVVSETYDALEQMLSE